MPDSDSPRAASAARDTDVEATGDDDPLSAQITDLAPRLREAFWSADWTVEAVLERLGATALQALGRNHTVAGQRVLGCDVDPQATLTRLWPLQGEVAVTDLQRALPDLVGPLVETGMVIVDGAVARAAIQIAPYGSDDGLSGWVASDRTPGLDGRPGGVADDWVLGVSPASTTTTQIAARTNVEVALDLGTGCGVQSLHLARHADRVIATDLNPRALRLARLTCALNDLTVDLRSGDLYRPLAGLTVDQIVSNPPYVMAPPEDAHLTYRESTRRTDGLVREVVVDGAAHLNPGGTLQVVGNWVHPRGGDWQDRLAGWVRGLGCQLQVIQREALSVEEYVEVWLADAGPSGTSGDTAAQHAWLDYLAAEQVCGVGLGWIFLTRTDERDPSISIEHWPHPVELPIGPHLAGRPSRIALAEATDATLLATCWGLTDDVQQETTGRPGAADPAHVVLRQHRGLRRGIEVDTALGGVLGACDGELDLGTLIGAVAGLLDQPTEELRGAVLRQVRPLITDGLLVAVQGPAASRVERS